MYDSKGKILKEFKQLFKDGQLPDDYKKNGIPRSVFIKKLAKKSYAELELEDFNKEYPKYETLLDELIEKESIWKTQMDRLLLPEKGKTPPTVPKPPKNKKTKPVKTQQRKIEQKMKVPVPIPVPTKHPILAAQEDTKKGGKEGIAIDRHTSVPKPLLVSKDKASKRRLVISIGIFLIMICIGAVVGFMLRGLGF